RSSSARTPRRGWRRRFRIRWTPGWATRFRVTVSEATSRPGHWEHRGCPPTHACSRRRWRVGARCSTTKWGPRPGAWTRRPRPWGTPRVSAEARRLAGALARRGALSCGDSGAAAGVVATQAEAGLAELVAGGYATAVRFAGWRA